MNRLLIVPHPVLARLVSNTNLPFSQTYSHTLTRLISQLSHPLSSLPTIATFCTSTSNQDLSTNHCVPCNTKDLQPMTHDAALTLLPQIADWNLVNEGGTFKLTRSWKVKTFTKGLEFFRIIADLAEAEGHHPDLHLVGWNNVTIQIWTHSVGGLTQNDFILASKINELNLHHLLRRNASD